MSYPRFESPTPDPQAVALAQARRAMRREDQRAWADLLCIWRFCDRTACRRARGCRGQSLVCFPRYAPLLPDNLKTWVKTLGEAQAQGFSFDQAMLRIGKLPLSEALSDWHLAVAASLCAPPRDKRDASATQL